jgi:hypothetical protein
MGRPRKQVDMAEIARLRAAGHSWPEIARRTSLAVGTVFQAYKRNREALEPFKNSNPPVLESVLGVKTCAKIPPQGFQ